ncbi:hypothetical protein RhiirA1_491185 [Rhizophagus irregularis]|uniref:Uncharacterized protein n=1 Tax=Rhizophagus irregularis TaxID=588596 RepID=A0A2N0SK49_9GLOM|nr:hypothetical protein RhiirA1_491185 [Rhizophagus irregularis]
MHPYRENLTGKEISLNPQFEVVGKENTGRVDYAIKVLKELIYITEGKQHQIAIGFAKVSKPYFIPEMLNIRFSDFFSSSRMFYNVRAPTKPTRENDKRIPLSGRTTAIFMESSPRPRSGIFSSTLQKGFHVRAKWGTTFKAQGILDRINNNEQAVYDLYEDKRRIKILLKELPTYDTLFKRETEGITNELCKRCDKGDQKKDLDSEDIAEIEKKEGIEKKTLKKRRSK